MFAVTMKVGEKFAIGPQAEIRITLVGVSGERIQLGIDTEASVPMRKVISIPSGVFHKQRCPKEPRYVVELATE